MSDETDPSDLDPETLVRMGGIETLNQGDLEATEKFYTDTATYRPSDDSEGTVADLIANAEEFKHAFPGVEATINEVTVDGDEVCFRYTVRGHHQNRFREIPATGESFETQGIAFARLEDGLIDEYSLVFDLLGMLQDLGVVGE